MLLSYSQSIFFIVYLLGSVPLFPPFTLLVIVDGVFIRFFCFLLCLSDDLNSTHQHCVLAGDTARFSSTHRMAEVRPQQV